MNATRNSAARATAYRLPEITTPENLEIRFMHNRGVILEYGSHILFAGYFYRPDNKCYYGATYRFTTSDHTCEGEIRLDEISEETFADNGHAIAWAISRAR